MKKIEKYNNKLAVQYDAATLSGGWLASREVARLVLDYNLAKNNQNILDIGIGTGQTIQSFLKHKCQIIGIDISSEMLKIAKAKYPKIKTFKNDLNNGLRRLDFKDSYFDVVIAVGILEFIKNIRKTLKEIYHILKVDGHLIFSYELLLIDNQLQKTKSQYIADGYSDNPTNISKFKLYRQSKYEINVLLKRCGFKVIKHYKIKAYQKGPNKIPVYYGIVLAKK